MVDLTTRFTFCIFLTFFRDARSIFNLFLIYENNTGLSKCLQMSYCVWTSLTTFLFNAYHFSLHEILLIMPHAFKRFDNILNIY